MDVHKHDHPHGEGGHHAHAAVPDGNGKLAVALLLTLSFAAIEAVAGWWSGSLALLSDAAHMLTDSSALGL
ncbi:MAG TPA: cation transporter, partial [Thiobacillus sp.]|nr:cation transporter [Thiobacillus sp.]